jgi:putative membrane-bound dehydrogenase-like protein
VPPGFTVTEFAGDDLAHDIYTMTLDPRGRVVVAGRGYVRLLVDDDGDGRADRAVEVADSPKDGAMGLLWEGDTLWVVGDGGLRRFRTGPDGKAVGPSELVRKLKTGGEHDAHALRRGPDGWLYLLCGNSTGLGAKDAQRPTSPVREPIAGGVLRFPPDLSYSEIVADGYRNPYGFDFNADGELFTYDSDNERCVGLPWYEGTRLYHVIPGGHYGWQAPQRAQTWRMPPYFADVVTPLADLGRGSPTGVACYRHRQFPEKYRGGLFLGEWTFGRVYFAALTRAGSTYTAKVETFLESVGDNGFAPTAVCVHPTTGDLYVSIGGRGTRGAVYRVRYPAGVKDAAGSVTPPLPPRSLEWRDGLKDELLRQAKADGELERRRALDLLWRHCEQFTNGDLFSVVKANWDTTDRGLRQALARLAGTLNAGPRAVRSPTRDLGEPLGSADVPVRFGPWLLFAAGRLGLWPGDGVGLCLGYAGDTSYPPADRLAAVRTAQRVWGVGARDAAGTVWEGYTLRNVRPLPPELERLYQSAAVQTCRDMFPTQIPELDRELSRTLAMFADDDPRALDKVIARLTPDSDPLDDIHYLIVLARLTAPRTAAVTRTTAEALLDLDRKLTARTINRDRNWPLRIAELQAELARKDPDLNTLLVADADFPRPANVLFTRCSGFDRRRAAERFYGRAEKTFDFAWNAELVQLMGELPADKYLPVLRVLWLRGGLEEAILPVLARHPESDDRDKFLAGLRSPQLAQAAVCLDALEKLPPATDPAEAFALVRVLRSLGDSKAEAPVRDRVTRRLQKLTGQAHGSDRAAWTAWLTKAHPDLAAKLGGADGVDVEGWRKRLAGIDWPAGDADRGKVVFTKASCAGCHSGGQALGPDLRGAAGRFSRDDLLTAIVQPSKDVSARYRTTQIATTDGKVYQGLVIYEAVDGLILQTGPATTVRIGGSQIESRGFSDTSLMPAGLMDKLSDREVADLLAYLKALK